MSILTGLVKYETFAEGSKSECQRPYIFLENGGKILLYKKNDNPFENRGFTEYEDKKVKLEGDFDNGIFKVDSVEIKQEFCSSEKSSVSENCESDISENLCCGEESPADEKDVASELSSCEASSEVSEEKE